MASAVARHSFTRRAQPPQLHPKANRVRKGKVERQRRLATRQSRYPQTTCSRKLDRTSQMKHCDAKAPKEDSRQWSSMFDSKDSLRRTSFTEFPNESANFGTKDIEPLCSEVYCIEPLDSRYIPPPYVALEIQEC
jgi:hypothetical protein